MKKKERNNTYEVAAFLLVGVAGPVEEEAETGATGVFDSSVTGAASVSAPPALSKY